MENFAENTVIWLLLENHVIEQFLPIPFNRKSKNLTVLKMINLQSLDFTVFHTEPFHFHFIFIFNFLGMVAPQLKRNCFTGGHAFKYSKNLINNLQLMNTINKKN